MDLINICPKPIKWNEIYTKLHRRWVLLGKPDVPPPVPLILAGWAYSNDMDKLVRWQQTLDWAEKMGLSNLTQRIEPEEMYRVADPTTYTVGPLYGPMYLPWNYTPKIKPSAEELEDALAKINANWENIIGENLSPVTDPIGFTGKKRRRLLVQVLTTENPPWGTWFSLARGEERRAFTDFRKAINETIKPLIVDHVDFVVKER